ncbi:MAG: small subunit ribosomal protein S6 [bacterium]|jgi:small subunit ribosomal protein S6
MVGYEITIVIDPSLTDEETGSVLDKFKEVIEKAEGSVPFESTWGRRRLAYEINRKQYGSYRLLFSVIDGAGIVELQKQFGYDDQVLKYFIYKVENLEEAYNNFESLKADPEKNVKILNATLEGGE